MASFKKKIVKKKIIIGEHIYKRFPVKIGFGSLTERNTQMPLKSSRNSSAII